MGEINCHAKFKCKLYVIVFANLPENRFFLTTGWPRFCTQALANVLKVIQLYSNLQIFILLDNFFKLSIPSTLHTLLNTLERNILGTTGLCLVAKSYTYNYNGHFQTFISLKYDFSRMKSKGIWDVSSLSKKLMVSNYTLHVIGYELSPLDFWFRLPQRLG